MNFNEGIRSTSCIIVSVLCLFIRCCLWIFDCAFESDRDNVGGDNDTSRAVQRLRTRRWVLDHKGLVDWMVPRSINFFSSIWEQQEPEQQRFYDSPPPRMDVSVCCLPASAGSGAQQHHHNAGLPSGGQANIQTPYHQYADQIVPDRGQPDGLAVLGCNSQDTWQQISSSPSGNVSGVTSNTTTAYIDYSWLQMQVRSII